MASTPSLPRGTRDFQPAEMARRNYIFDTIRSVFQLYGYQPIETPAMENLSNLLGKYGEEGDKLIFRILNSGDFLSEVPAGLLESRSSGQVTPYVSEKGLRYDLTVPFARFVVQHRNEIVFPFRRYQVQPVWRADRPQKGRYREFYQCDCDVIGSNSLISEAELVQVADEVFTRLRIQAVVKINNRKVLAGLAEVMGCPEKLTDITVAIDKIEKSGLSRVREELLGKGIPMKAMEKLEPVLLLQGSNVSKMEVLAGILADSAVGQEGLRELKTLFAYLEVLKLSVKVDLDLSLARGLNYYTGAILEVKALGMEMGSICGGGRYDDLAGIFGMPGVSGVGISFGAERIYDILLSLDLFPPQASVTTRVLLLNFGPAAESFILPVAALLRKHRIATELYPEADKIKKQMNYANRKEIPYVLLAGEEEISRKQVTLKNMATGEQQTVVPGELVRLLCPDGEREGRD